MLGPAQWRVSSRRSKKRAEPAATDSGSADVPGAICARMASGMPCERAAAAAAARSMPNKSGSLLVPVSSDNVLMYATAVGVSAPIAYGAYVVHAALYGVPQLSGLRDYWRHAYLFRERALRAAFGAPVPPHDKLASAVHTADGECAAAAAAVAAAPEYAAATPDAKQQLLDERIVVTGGLGGNPDTQTDSLSVTSSPPATPSAGATSHIQLDAPADEGRPVCSGIRAASSSRVLPHEAECQCSHQCAHGQAESAPSSMQQTMQPKRHACQWHMEHHTARLRASAVAGGAASRRQRRHCDSVRKGANVPLAHFVVHQSAQQHRCSAARHQRLDPGAVPHASAAGAAGTCLMSKPYSLPHFTAGPLHESKFRECTVHDNALFERTPGCVRSVCSIEQGDLISGRGHCSV